jgi:hypothetical protein
MTQRTRTALLLTFLTLCWSAATALGFFLLERYKATPGQQATSNESWPADSVIQPEPGSYNFVLAINSHCPCSRATVTELAQILQGHERDVVLHALVYRPASFSEGWQDSALLADVKSISQARLTTDIDAREAERFGIYTSGGLVLFGPRGARLFQGGITQSRGHGGETAAHEAIRTRLLGVTSDLYVAPVFGCPLRESRS